MLAKIKAIVLVSEITNRVGVFALAKFWSVGVL